MTTEPPMRRVLSLEDHNGEPDRCEVTILAPGKFALIKVALEGGREAVVLASGELSMTDVELMAWQLANQVREDTGSRVIRGTDGGGQRDFLDGRPISCGTGLELVREDGTAVGVRYEATYFGVLATKRPVMYLDDCPGSVDRELPILPFHRFRWPARRAT